jgi:hypothetical protein
MSQRVHLTKEKAPGHTECGRWIANIKVDKQNMIVESRLTTTKRWGESTCYQCRYWPVINAAKSAVYGTRNEAYYRR